MIPDNDKIIEISNLTKDFKEVRAVDNLNINVFKGDVFGFLGPNGAGKSTTIRMLLSLISPKEPAWQSVSGMLTTPVASVVGSASQTEQGEAEGNSQSAP